ncbi:MAG: glycosyltransferase [Dehalococcoidia bacterium]|nr:glycosyltransferase [Dehalococcoidia bacterium]
MKILVITSTIDLKNKLGCTPAWWQLLKALYEIGNDVIVIPYLGKPVESLWWRTYDNPCEKESAIYNAYLKGRKKAGESPSKRTLLTPIATQMVKHYIKPKWGKYLIGILEKERDTSLLLFMNIPINHITGIPSQIKNQFHIPVVYYDGDMPTSLPQYTVDRGFKFNYYESADVSEYDAFFTNSKGCVADLEKMGAKNVSPLYYGIDPELVAPIEMERNIDVSFFGYGSELREEWMENLITIPSQKMPEAGFTVAGGGFRIDLGNAKMIGDLSYSQWRHLCCRSKINLNITRWSHTNVYASSTSRPFELAAFGSCIVSQPYNGIEEWFEVGKELFVVHSADEAIGMYKMLLSSDELRQRTGELARQRVLKQHTFKHRAEQFMETLREKLGTQ